MKEERSIWSFVHERLHPACGSEAMLITITGEPGKWNLDGHHSRVGKVVTISPAANDSPWLAVTS